MQREHLPKPAIEELRANKQALLNHLVAPRTRMGYGHDWRMFCAWCVHHEIHPLPATADTVSLYLVAMLHRRLKLTTVTRHASAIAFMHRDAGFTSPVDHSVREMLQGARRYYCQSLRQMKPVTVEQLRAISESLALDGSPRSIRNRALLLFGFATALRRSTLCDLLAEDVELEIAGGIVVHIRREKQDQEGRGRLVGVPPGKRPSTCAVTALRAWMQIRGPHAGPVFTHITKAPMRKRLQPASIGRIVQEGLRRIGVNPDGYAGHSLRGGLVTAAAEAGASDLLIASHTGHSSMNVLRGYVRRANLFRANACSMIEM